MSQRIRLERFSLKDLLEGKNISAIDETSLEEIALLICRGGGPKAIGLDEKTALFQTIDCYDAVISTDISRVDSIKGLHKIISHFVYNLITY